ncbi:MAG: hypothetical protein P1V97_23565 [Planctomycetota bacterium]|nr:hypothetical protein [Planctomycetota bacterium]
MMNRATIQRLFVAFFLSLVADTPSYADDESAANKTEAEFRSVIDSVQETKEKVDQLRSNLHKAYKATKTLRDPRQRKLWKSRIRGLQKHLNKYSKLFAKFGKFSKNVTDGFDAIRALQELKAKISGRRGGGMAKYLDVLARVGEKFGDKVPCIGKAVAWYGKETLKLLDKTDQLAQDLEKRNQGMFGIGQTVHSDDLRYQSLVNLYGRKLADSGTWAPVLGRSIYRLIGQDQGKHCLIWDQENKKWYKIDGRVPVEQMYHEALLAGKRLNARELHGLASRYGPLKIRIESADRFYKTLQKMRHSFDWEIYQAFNRVNSRHKSKLWTMLHRLDQEEFRARYLHDKSFRASMDSLLGELRKELIGKKRDQCLKALQRSLNPTEKRRLNRLRDRSEVLRNKINGFQKAIASIVKDAKDGLLHLKKDILATEMAIQAQIKAGLAFIATCQKNAAAAKNPEARKVWQQRAKETQSMLADGSFLRVWYNSPRSGPERHMRIKSRRERQKKAREVAQSLVKHVASGEMTSFDTRHWGVRKLFGVTTLKRYRELIQLCSKEMSGISKQYQILGRELSPVKAWEEPKLSIPKELLKEK